MPHTLRITTYEIFVPQTFSVKPKDTDHARLQQQSIKYRNKKNTVNPPKNADEKEKDKNKEKGNYKAFCVAHKRRKQKRQSKAFSVYANAKKGKKST